MARSVIDRVLTWSLATLPMQAAVRSASSAVPRVLIADGDDDIRVTHRDSFAQVGCDVVEATDGRDALVKALVRVPSLIVTELNLPIMDGVALCEILRRDRVTAHVPILVVTAETDPTRLAHAKQAGADALLHKPTHLRLLVEEADRLLTLSTAVRGRAATARNKVQEQLRKSAQLLQDSVRHARAIPRSREHMRFMTTAPPVAPPRLRCPNCDRALKYTASHIGGVSAEHPEQWDYFVCDQCGEFRYRQRTRKLRQII
jgi:CheY-like chemotaxis protein